MIDRFVASRRYRWDRMAQLLRRTARPPAGLSIEELDELARLYRQSSADLAVARRDFPNDVVTRALNQLVARAYGQLYREPPALFSALWAFAARDLPRDIRSGWAYLAGSAALLFLPLLIASLAAGLSSTAAEVLVSPGLLAEIREGRTWFEWEFATSPIVASFIMFNNIRVAAMAFGGGMFAGIGTVAVLILNGLSIGGIIGALTAHGLGDKLVGFVSPHGFLELTAIVVSGACGLMLGRAILWPGLQTRGSAIIEAAKRAVRWSLASQLLLVPAGVLEGFVSPIAFPWQFKLAIGLGTFVPLLAYLLLAGRGSGGLPKASPGLSAPGSGLLSSVSAGPLARPP